MFTNFTIKGLQRAINPLTLLSLLAVLSMLSAPANAGKAFCQQSLKAKLINRFIHPQTGHSVYGKIAVWDLGTILSILHKRSYTKVHSILDYSVRIGFLIGNEILPVGSDLRGRYVYDHEEAWQLLNWWEEAQDTLADQYPELLSIKAPTFQSTEADLEYEVHQWLLPLKERYGRYLPVVQLDLWSESPHH